jgi:hypothetical protein
MPFGFTEKPPIGTEKPRIGHGFATTCRTVRHNRDYRPNTPPDGLRAEGERKFE